MVPIPPFTASCPQTTESNSLCLSAAIYPPKFFAFLLLLRLKYPTELWDWQDVANTFKHSVHLCCGLNPAKTNSLLYQHLESAPGTLSNSKAVTWWAGRYKILANISSPLALTVTVHDPQLHLEYRRAE